MNEDELRIAQLEAAARGAMTFEGEPCPVCGSRTRYVAAAYRCVRCHREDAKRRWHAKHNRKRAPMLKARQEAAKRALARIRRNQAAQDE